MTRFSLLASVAGWHGGNHFFALFETLPDLILLHSILKQYPVSIAPSHSTMENVFLTLLLTANSELPAT